MEVHSDPKQQDGLYPFRVTDLVLNDPIVPAPPSPPGKIHLNEVQSAFLSKLDGDKVLVPLPTGNQEKAKILRQFVQHIPDERIIYVIVTIAGSQYGEQPYCDAGPKSARNRIMVGLNKLIQGDFDKATFVNGELSRGDKFVGRADEFCRSNSVGEIMFPSIENYINGEYVSLQGIGLDEQPGGQGWRKGRSRIAQQLTAIPEATIQKPEVKHTLRNPADYGYALLCCIKSNGDPKMFAAHSRGVRLPTPKGTDLVAIAMGYGHFGDSWQYGAVTVGKVIQALVEPENGIKLDSDWHKAVTRDPLAGSAVSRYDLLAEAVNDIRDQRAKAEEDERAKAKEDSLRSRLAGSLAHFHHQVLHWLCNCTHGT